MPIVIPKEGVTELIDLLLSVGQGSVAWWQLMLFTNDLTPDADTVYADLVEPSAAWYARRGLDPALWQPAELVGSDAQALYGEAAQVYADVDAEVTVYGYAVNDPAANRLRWVERLDPVLTVPAGRGLTLWPRLRLGSWCPCPVSPGG